LRRSTGKRPSATRHLSERLRGAGETDPDIPLDDEAVRLRVEAILSERGRLTNAEIRRISGFSRAEALRMMQAMAEQGLVALRGKGCGAHYILRPRMRARRGVTRKPRRK